MPAAGTIPTQHGIAATFNTPLAGVFFAMELILRDFTAESFGAVVLSSVTASVVGRAVLGDGAFLQLPPFHVGHPVEYLLYAVLGLAAGAVGVGFPDPLPDRGRLRLGVARAGMTPSGRRRAAAGRPAAGAAADVQAVRRLALSEHGALPVTDAGGAYRGTVSPHGPPRRPSARTRRRPRRSATWPSCPLPVTGEQTLADALQVLVGAQGTGLPVLDAEQNALIGWITHQTVLSALRPARRPEAGEAPDDRWRDRAAARRGRTS